jgi:hypothetical protein
MPRKRKAMNEDAFVEDFASGLYTQRQLAKKHGISLPLVQKIATGRRRPDLRERIDEARGALCRQSQQQLVGLLDAAVGVLRKAMAGPATPALAAAREVFNRVLGKPEAAGAVEARAAADAPHDKWYSPDSPDLVDLSPETKRLVLKELGGPSPDDKGYGPMDAEEPGGAECAISTIASEGSADQ